MAISCYGPTTFYSLYCTASSRDPIVPTSPKPPASPAALARQALARLLASPGDHRLVTTKTAAGLFAGATGANRAAIDICLSGKPPLLREARRDGKAVFVLPTPAGLLEAMSGVPGPAAAKSLLAWSGVLSPDEFAEVATRFTTGAPPEDQPEILAELAPGLGNRAGEVAAAVEAAAAAAAAAERAAYLARYRLARDHHRARRARAEDDARWHAAAERQFEQLLPGAEAGDDRNATGVQEPGAAFEPRPLPPPAPADREFRRAVVEEMVEGWRAASGRGNRDTAHMIECLLRNIPGVERVGEAGAAVDFDPAVHDSAEFLDTGAAATVVVPGWAIRGDRGAYTVLKAEVAPG